MAAAYTKEFLINVFLHRYRSLGKDEIDSLRKLATDFFDSAGRDKFRVYACVTPEAVREYKKFSLESAT